MEDQRDTFDAKYETSRYEDSLVMGDALDARQFMEAQAKENDRIYQQRK